MTPLDWAIVAGLLLVLLVAALRTRRYTHSVSAFLVAERCGGRYLISMANAMAGMGVISLVYWFEMYYEAGFTAYWWGAMTEPALVVLALSGWVIYRFRETRAMTLAQFFEMRYSRNFRVFAGIVAYLSGIINFGIFPAVGARFFKAMCGLPDNLAVAGIQLSTLALLLLLLLAVSLLFTFLGGHIAVMVTDFIQGVFTNFVFAVVILFLLLTLGWNRISEALLQAPLEKSLVHPFHVGEQHHFNIWYYLISVAIVFYGVLGWQGTQGYNACAKDAHEAKMAGILNGWRFRVLLLIGLVVPIAVFTVLHHPDFAVQSAKIRQALDSIQAPTTEETSTLQHQLRTPLALAVILPAGLLGLMCAAMLAAFISTHDTYLHSWGSIFIQDVVLPFRKRPFSPRRHLLLLRLSILGVAIFIFLFSMLFRQTQFIAMFTSVTAAIFVGGAGSVIIGGLYWKRGTTAGAWSAMITGMVFSLGGVLVKQLKEEQILWLAGEARAFVGSGEWLQTALAYLKQEVTGQLMAFWAVVAAILMYVLVSLLGPRKIHDMNRLLHRGGGGKAADSTSDSGSGCDAGTDSDAASDTDSESVPGSHTAAASDPGAGVMPKTFFQKLGIDREFTGGDRIVACFSVGWPLIWTLIFVAGTSYSLIRAAEGNEVGSETWLSFWNGYLWVTFVGMVAVTIWFTIGGVKDLRYLFSRLEKGSLEPGDDGRVNREPEEGTGL